MEEPEKDHELGEHAERLVGVIESELQYDERGTTYFRKDQILNLVFRVADFMRQLSKRI